jgi:hypothetical protein
MAEKMKEASREMTLAQAFERTYSSPKYRAPVERERREAHARLNGNRVPLR